MIPDHLRNRLEQEIQNAKEAKKANKKGGNLKSYLKEGHGKAGENNQAKISSEKPLADLYLETTVLNADISGFTSWSSVREPSQVFILLETLFQEFDEIAKKRRIFKGKIYLMLDFGMLLPPPNLIPTVSSSFHSCSPARVVETVGDKYVCVTGLPEPRKDHAVAMTRYARNILNAFQSRVRALEIVLGPDTSDLGLRIGMHSGPVTAGVLRGDRARFQLFGTTMNVCAKLEKTGKRGRIHCSIETAEILKASGKENWLTKCENEAGFSTYWVSMKEKASAGSTGSGSFNTGSVEMSTSALRQQDDKMSRLVQWNVETLLHIMKLIVLRRAAVKSAGASKLVRKSSSCVELDVKATPLEEVREIIRLPEFDATSAQQQQDPIMVEIPSIVCAELHKLVATIAGMYNNNPFHNFGRCARN